MDPWNAFIEFYVSLVTYTVLHMIFVISSDFVEAFNIPPLNIGIYVDKLAAIRALLMVIADIVEWQILDKALGGSMNGKMAKSLESESNNPRRIGSIISFIGMFACRLAYLIIVFKSNNKSLSVFITLCIEGFLFGVFQMSFFAIGPEYNALTSLGIHTMGNFIFFLQLILNKLAKSYPSINCLSRVRVHAWVCLITSLIALALWLYFCYKVDAKDEDAPSEWPKKDDVWSPFWLFIIGAFAEDFSVPGILPFAFLDPEKANLVNYLTPVFFMSGALVIVFSNDIFSGNKGLGGTNGLGLNWENLGFKDWSASTAPDADLGQYWHSLWLLNIPKYIAFFISMWSIHGTFDNLRCIIQSRWRVMILTLNVVIPRATLEVAGYVGVANFAIGRSNFGLVEAELYRALAYKLKERGVTSLTGTADTLVNAIDNETNKVKETLAGWIKFKYFSSIEAKNIQVSKDTEGTDGKVKVTLTGSGVKTGDGTSTQNVTQTGQNNVKVTIKIERGKNGSLSTTSDNNAAAQEIADKIASFVALAALVDKLTTINSAENLTTDKLKTAIGETPSSSNQVQNAIAALVRVRYGGATVNTGSSGFEITAEVGGVGDPGKDKLKVVLTGTGIAGGTNSVDLKFTDSDNKGVTVTIKISGAGSLKTKTGGGDNHAEATELATMIKGASVAAAKKQGRPSAFTDFGAFAYIAYHDILAMFCRFVYGKFAVGYNWTRVSLGYCLPKFRPRHKGFGFGFWWWVGRTLSRAWADTVKDFKADIKCYL